ncbi:hypothetical protein NBRC116492_10760 [Aurantivibrio infirmus]
MLIREGLLRDVIDIILDKDRLNIPPLAKYPIAVQNDSGAQSVNAVWSVLISPKEEGDGFRAMKSKRDNKPYKTFNAKSTMLQKSPTWKPLFPSKRCIVPVSHFHEWAGKQCYKIAPIEKPLAFGGLYKVWEFCGEIVHSFAIITLPGHSKLQHIHKQSVPLILEEKDFDMWLDPDFRQLDAFKNLLESHIPIDLKATPVDSPSKLNEIGEEEFITKD